MFEAANLRDEFSIDTLWMWLDYLLNQIFASTINENHFPILDSEIGYKHIPASHGHIGD